MTEDKFQGALARTREYLRDKGRKAPRRDSNETAAVAAVRTYLGAQATFHRTDFYGKGMLVYANPKDGAGFPDLRRLPDGTALKMIDPTFARATSPETARAGYYFVDIEYDDYSIDCGLCAVPAEYGVTGENTFIIDVTGVTYQKDNGGQPVTVYPDVAKAGWIPVGSPGVKRGETPARLVPRRPDARRRRAR